MYIKNYLFIYTLQVIYDIILVVTNNFKYLLGGAVMKLNYKELSDYQTFWQESEHLSQKQKDGLITLSNLLIQRAKENQDEIDNVTLLYPEDYSDFDIFSDFSFAMSAFLTVRKEGGAKISGWTLNREVDVE